MLNVQTEHLENHTARLTVEVDAERLDKALHQAARKLSKKGRIPGFRPGKAPFNVVMNMYGHEYVLAEALDDLGNEIYREALDAAEIQPYAPGSLDQVEEEGHKLVFVVPKRPTVDLGNYREIRVDYEVPEVTDEMVNRAMENLRQSQALLEPADRPAKLTDQVTVSHIFVTALPDSTEEEAESAEGEADEEGTAQGEVDTETDAGSASGEVDVEGDHDADASDDEDTEQVILHEHNFDRVLIDDENDLFPGFSDQLVGLSAGDDKQFVLEIPDDYDDEELAGRSLHCDLRVEKVQARTVPDWSDMLAKRISQDKFESILELRVETRKNLQQSAENLADRQLAVEALDKLVEGATISYPEEYLQDYITDLLADLEQSVLRQQGLTLKDYLRITGQTEEDLRQNYRESGIKRAERSLALGELVRQEQLDASDEDIDSEIDRIVASIGGEQSPRFRQFLSTQQSRMNIGADLITSRAMERLAAIAKGENPPIGAAQAEATAALEAAEEPAAEAVEPVESAGEVAAVEPVEETGETERTD
ncbi:MAG TPA: trigger factor [Aggregatilineales bacterium]|nr:trigger factor [Aggregatilineales bacterium]